MATKNVRSNLYIKFIKYLMRLSVANRIAILSLVVTAVIGLLALAIAIFGIFIAPPLAHAYENIIATPTFIPSQTLTSTLLPTPSYTPSLIPTSTFTITPTITNTSTPLPTPVFNYNTFLSVWTNIQSDTFQTDSIKDWIVGPTGKDSIVTPSIDNGSFSISISTHKRALYETFIRNGFNASGDMALSIEAKLVNQGGCGYGIIFKGDVTDDYYVFSLFNEAGYPKGLRYSITKVTPALDQKRAVLEIGRLSLKIGIPNILSVVSVGENTYFFVNNLPLTVMSLDSKKDSIHGGKVGIEVMVCQGLNTDFKFENFQLRTPKDLEKKLPINLPTQYYKVEYSSAESTSDDIVNEVAGKSPDYPDNIDLSTDNNSEYEISQGVQIQTYKVSARFYNPPETSWSYGYVFSHNDNNSCWAYLRSDSVFEVDCLGIEYFSVIDNLIAKPGAYNDLEIQVNKNQLLFKVNGKTFFYYNFSEPLPTGWVSLHVGLDDEKTDEYIIHITNMRTWSPLLATPDPNLLNQCEPNEKVRDWPIFTFECQIYLTFNSNGKSFILYPPSGQTKDVDILRFQYTTSEKPVSIIFSLEIDQPSYPYQFEVFDNNFNFLGNSSPNKFFSVGTQAPETKSTYYIRVYSENEGDRVRGYTRIPYRISAEVY
jgi:hypothetical protein